MFTNLSYCYQSIIDDYPPRILSILPRALEFHFGGKLKDTRIRDGWRYGALLSLRHVAIRTREVGRVGHIEGLYTNLQDQFLRWLEVLQLRSVKVNETGPAHQIAAGATGLMLAQALQR